VCTILLMCKRPLIPFYSDAGFTLVGQSDVVHGADPWFEMRCQVTKENEKAAGSIRS